MNHSFLQVLNEITIAFQAKKLKLVIKYSKQNFQFLQYLLEQRFISGFNKKNKLLIITLKYETSLMPSLSGSSSCSKTSHKRAKKRIKFLDLSLTNSLTENNKTYTRLLACFR